MKNLQNLKGVKSLNKNEQQQINGGWFVNFSCNCPEGFECINERFCVPIR